MNPNYNQNHTREEIDSVVKRIHRCVAAGKYIISMNSKRKENIDFINEYNIRTEKQKSILMRIRTEDFCYSLKNTNVGFEDEILYVFAPSVELYNLEGKKEIVDVYTKFNFICDRTVVISFHKLNRPIKYLFKGTA